MDIRCASRIAELADDWRATLTHRSIFTIPEWLATDEAEVARYLLCGDTGLIIRRGDAGGFTGNDPIALLLATLDSLDPKEIEQLRAGTANRLDGCYPVAAAALPGGYLPGLVGERRPEAV